MRLVIHAFIGAHQGGGNEVMTTPDGFGFRSPDANLSRRICSESGNFTVVLEVGAGYQPLGQMTIDRDPRGEDYPGEDAARLAEDLAYRSGVEIDHGHRE